MASVWNDPYPSSDDDAQVAMHKLAVLFGQWMRGEITPAIGSGMGGSGPTSVFAIPLPSSENDMEPAMHKAAVLAGLWFNGTLIPSTS